MNTSNGFNLKPFVSLLLPNQPITLLHRLRFYDGVNSREVADHIVREALVFSDTGGFDFLDNFKRTQIWEFDKSTPITAFAAFTNTPLITASDTLTFINVEISAQLLLAWRLWQDELKPNIDSSWLRPELEKLRLPSQLNPMCAGLPYLVTHPTPMTTTGSFTGDYYRPIIDSTAYLLYDYWNFNPFTASTRKGVGPYCAGDRLVRLKIEGQQQEFPRLFLDGQNFSNFPQEINDGNHKSIVISFTTTTTQSLFTIPLTLTVDTVDRSNLILSATLDNGDHCLADFEPRTTIGPIISETAYR